MGRFQRPGTLHKWVYAGNDPVNFADPSGYARIKIWASAFIEPSHVEFPQFFPWPPFVDPYARWHGDSRSFYSGGKRPSARVWHEVVLDTDYVNIFCDPYQSYPNFIVTNDADTEETLVTFYAGPLVTIPMTQRGKTPAPSKATVHAYSNVQSVVVRMEAHTPNPLTPEGTPPIDYEYHLIFDLLSGSITFGGEHDWYPWHELYIEVDGLPVAAAAVQYTPQGITGTAADLWMPPIPLGYRHVPITHLGE
ncbi:MAG TPA: DUF3238 domain-containing protein [Bacillota bacterium]|nr:DUF3238 domain-containing protein [Bacillota bacterium]